MINYARLTPVYIAKVFSMKDKGPETWSMFSGGNFSVNKTLIPFSAIGVDHAIEQDVLTKKVLPESLAMEFLETEREGRKLYEKFIEERMVGSKSIWDTINKRKLPTFTNNKKVVTVKI